MPFYEYQCSACEHYLEVLQKISDTPLRKCPNCGKSTLKRLISAPVFRLKGGGWYETDFKSDNEQKRNIHGSEEPAADKSDAKAGADNGSKDKGTDAKSEGSGSKPAEGSGSQSGASKASSRSGASHSSAKPAARSKPVKASRPAAKAKSVKAAKSAKKRASR